MLTWCVVREGNCLHPNAQHRCQRNAPACIHQYGPPRMAEDELFVFALTRFNYLPRKLPRRSPSRTYIHTYVHAYVHTYVCTYIHVPKFFWQFFEDKTFPSILRAYIHTYIHMYKTATECRFVEGKFQPHGASTIGASFMVCPYYFASYFFVCLGAYFGGTRRKKSRISRQVRTFDIRISQMFWTLLTKCLSGQEVEHGWHARNVAGACSICQIVMSRLLQSCCWCYVSTYMLADMIKAVPMSKCFLSFAIFIFATLLRPMSPMHVWCMYCRPPTARCVYFPRVPV